VSIRVPRVAAIALAVAAALALGGCASAAAPAASPATKTADALSGDLTVYAAASLSGAFDELAKEFGMAHPGVTVKPITYDGSSVLATQLIGGAPADVFASADQKNMQKVTDAKLASNPVNFATNIMEIAAAPGNPLGITDLASLAKPTSKGTVPTVVLCAPAVPCGSAAQTLLKNAGVTLKPASEEQNVTAVLTKVKSGDADAGMVYVTDVKAAGSAVTGVPIEGADAATNVYPIVELTKAPNPQAAAAFVDFVAGPEGQAVLKKFGFGAP
jgi:molybdate transport system substrate-binding protein